MASQPKSRWVDDEETLALEAQRKREKEAKKKAKAERQRRLEEEALRKQQQGASAASDGVDASVNANAYEAERPSKKRKLSPPGVKPSNTASEQQPTKLLRFPVLEWGPCRHVDNFEKLNHIEEGSYGWVSRAKDIDTGDVVAL